MLLSQETHGILNTNFMPDAHLVYQRSLGPTASVGLNYVRDNTFKEKLLDPYLSVDIGLYGQAYNTGVRLGGTWLG